MSQNVHSECFGRLQILLVHTALLVVLSRAETLMLGHGVHMDVHPVLAQHLRRQLRHQHGLVARRVLLRVRGHMVARVRFLLCFYNCGFAPVPRVQLLARRLVLVVSEERRFVLRVRRRVLLYFDFQRVTRHQRFLVRVGEVLV